MSQTRIPDPKIDALRDLFTSLDSELLSTLDRVQLLRMITETAQSATPDAVHEAHREGQSWDRIGRALGISRQAAWERYRA